MKIPEFKLERWLFNPCEIDLGGGGVTKLKLRDIIDEVDTDQLLKYGVTNGSAQLRSEIAEWYPGVSADNVLVTAATSEANLLCHLHILEPGDEYVAVYPMYEQTTGFADSLGCAVKKTYLDTDNEWKIDLDRLKNVVTEKTRAIFFDNPNNPTGARVTKDEMAEICRLADSIGAFVICDGALRGSESDGEPALAPFPRCENGIVTGSLSKLGITGIRIGWIIGNGEVVEACWKIKDYTTLSHSSIGEYLATIALRTENRRRYENRNRKIAEENRSIASDWIEENAELVSWVRPGAGFTGFIKYTDRIELDSERFCVRFLEEEKVLISPGLYFDMDRHFRLNVGCEHGDLREGLSRLRGFMTKLVQTP